MSSETKVTLATIAAQNNNKVRKEQQILKNAWLFLYQKPASELFKIVCDSIIEQSLTTTLPYAEFDLFTSERCQKVEGLSGLNVSERRDLVEMLEIMLRKENFRINSVIHNSETSLITIGW